MREGQDLDGPGPPAQYGPRWRAWHPRGYRFSPKEDVMDRRDILAERPLESGRGFMPAVSVNPSRLLFTAGLTGRNPDGKLVAGGMGPQARRTFERLHGVLPSAEPRFDNVIIQRVS